MGKSLADSFPEAARVFQEADQALGFSLSINILDAADAGYLRACNKRGGGEIDGFVADSVCIVIHCCPRQDGPVAWSAENTRLGETPGNYLGGGLRFEVWRPVQIMPAPG